MTYSCTFKYGGFEFDVTYDGDQDDFWIEAILLDGKDCSDIISSKIEQMAFEWASDHFWDNYWERMTCAAEDRYDYLTDR